MRHTYAVIKYDVFSGDLGANVVFEGSKEECDDYFSSFDPLYRKIRLDIIVLETQN